MAVMDVFWQCARCRRGPVRHAVVALLAVVALAGAVSACSSTDPVADGAASSMPEGLMGITRPDPIRAGEVRLPDVTVGGSGGEFAMRARPGELLVGYFGFTSCPDVCPTTLFALKTAEAQLGDAAEKVGLAMVTVDPGRDTPEKLTSYLGNFADRSHALRPADEAQLEAAEEVFGASSSVTTTEDGTIEVSHTGTAYVIDDQGTVLVEWPFGVSADDMASDLRILLDQRGVDVS
jgi:protein SCO1/2